jgi:uncharacterized protein (TIGR02001 family)
MRKTIIAASLALAAFAAPQLASAQAAAPAAAPPSDHTFTGNMALVSDYRFRGITQTFEKPALQGGFDYSHSSGIYLGNWNSNISSGAGFPGGNLEMDFYGGWKKSWGDWGLDLGAIYYFYPGTSASSTNPSVAPFSPTNVTVGRTGTIVHSGSVDNTELYIGGSWKFISLKYFHAMSDYFAVPGTKNSSYWDLSANYDLGGGWAIQGHIGSLNFKNQQNGDYTDWKIGVTKDLGGWILGAAYIDTDGKGDCGTWVNNAANPQPYCFSNGHLNPTGTFGYDKTKDASKGTVVFSVSKSF